VNDCQFGRIRVAQKDIKQNLWDKGYAGMDILITMFKVVKNHPSLPEYLKLEFLKEIGFAHKQALEGCESLVQISGLLAKMCKTAKAAKN
jgi:replication factor C subunit 2/4